MTIAAGGFFHTISAIFHPIFGFFGRLLAFFYAIIPNYAVAIALLTLVIMGALTPFTVKSTKSMIAMQRLQPEIKKLQQKYKGPENRQTLNEEMMKLYREEGANPLGGCLPLLLQAPFLFMLYSVIRGIAHTLKNGKPDPLYIPNSAMKTAIVSSHGHVNAFGIDIASKPFSPHSSWIAAVPFFVLVIVAVGLQYFQMWQMNNRSKKTGQVVPKQQQTIQRIMPIFFTYFYIVIPAAVVLYMIVSTVVRIVTQDILFRTGVSNPQTNKERKLPARQVENETEEEPPALERKNSQPKGASSKNAPKPSTPPAHPRSKAKRKRKDR